MAYTVEMLARRWGISTRDVLAYGTRGKDPLIFEVDATGAKIFDVISPGSDNPTVGKATKALGLYAAIDCAQQLLSRGEAELTAVGHARDFESKERLALRAEILRCITPVFSPSVRITQDSLLISERSIQRFEEAHPELFNPASATPDNGAPAALGIPAPVRPDQEHKAEFQKYCIDQWRITSTMKVRGHGGMIDAVGEKFLRMYTPDTLIRWATEVAPPGVLKPGRPRKKTTL